MVLLSLWSEVGEPGGCCLGFGAVLWERSLLVSSRLLELARGSAPGKLLELGE